jgi:hypothetical protein
MDRLLEDVVADGMEASTEALTSPREARVAPPAVVVAGAPGKSICLVTEFFVQVRGVPIMVGVASGISKVTTGVLTAGTMVTILGTILAALTTIISMFVVRIHLGLILI